MPSLRSQLLVEHYRRSNAIAAMDPPLTLSEFFGLPPTIELADDVYEHWGM